MGEYIKYFKIKWCRMCSREMGADWVGSCVKMMWIYISGYREMLLKINKYFVIVDFDYSIGFDVREWF